MPKTPSALGLGSSAQHPPVWADLAAVEQGRDLRREQAERAGIAGNREQIEPVEISSAAFPCVPAPTISHETETGCLHPFSVARAPRVADHKARTILRQQVRRSDGEHDRPGKPWGGDASTMPRRNTARRPKTAEPRQSGQGHKQLAAFGHRVTSMIVPRADSAGHPEQHRRYSSQRSFFDGRPPK